MKRLMQYSWVVVLLLGVNVLLAQQTKEKKVLIIGMDTAQFYSNQFYIDDLAWVNNTNAGGVAIPYKNMLEYALFGYAETDFVFVRMPKLLEDSVHLHTAYRTVSNETEDYLGLVPKLPQADLVPEIAALYKVDYILSLNLYEILADTISKYDVGSRHVIHYDLFARDMKLIKGGRYIGRTYDVWPEYLTWFYKDFALDVTLWAGLHQAGKEITDATYTEAVAQFELDKFGLAGKKSLGISLGYGMPEGGIGVRYSQMKNEYLEWNAGLGWDFAGLKLSAGLQYYLMGFRYKTMPFVGLNYAFASGNTFVLGDMKNEFGEIIDPSNVSKHQIFSDHAMHLGVGLNVIIAPQVSLIPVFNYAFPFARKQPVLLSGKDSDRRNNVVSALGVGGAGAGLNLVIYF